MTGRQKKSSGLCDLGSSFLHSGFTKRKSIGLNAEISYFSRNPQFPQKTSSAEIGPPHSGQNFGSGDAAGVS